MLCGPQLIRFSASPSSPGRTSLLYCTGHIKLITLINHLLQGGTGEPPRGQCTIDELEALLMCSLCEALAFVTAKHLSRRIPFRSPASGSPANAAAAAAAAGDGGESMLAAAVVTKRRAPQRAEPGRRRAVRVFTSYAIVPARPSQRQKPLAAAAQLGSTSARASLYSSKSNPRAWITRRESEDGNCDNYYYDGLPARAVGHQYNRNEY